MTITADTRRAPLARSADGEPFVVAVEACAWRVRRFRAPGTRGAPELVYGDDALPLEIPIDTPIAEFRELVGNRTGRYRLDAVDLDGVGVPKSSPAYLQIDPPDAGRTSAAATVSAPTDPMLEALREVLRVNSELAATNSQLAQTVIERLPSVIESAAGLVRAADGAGLPHRAPAETRNALALPAPAEEVDDDELDGWPATVAHVVDQVMPMLQMVIAHRMGGTAPRNAATARRSARQTTANPAAAATAENGSMDAAGRAAGTPTDPMPAPSPDQLVHFAQIQAALSPREAQVARALLAQLRSREVEAWLAELSDLSVDEAVALIRRHLETAAPATPRSSATPAPTSVVAAATETKR